MNLLTLPKSISANNPIPGGCRFYAPLGNPSCWGSTFESIDPYGHICTRFNGVMGPTGFTLDGDDYMDVASSTVFDFGNGTTDSPFSVLAWIKPTDTDTSNHAIVVKYRQDKRQWNFLTATTPVIALQCIDQSANSWIGRTAPFLEATYANKWTLVTATYSGNSTSAGVKIYAGTTQIDNADSTSGAYTAMEPFTVSPVSLGMRRDALTDVKDLYFTGTLGEIFIYEREVALLEIGRIEQVTKWRYS